MLTESENFRPLCMKGLHAFNHSFPDSVETHGISEAGANLYYYYYYYY